MQKSSGRPSLQSWLAYRCTVPRVACELSIAAAILGLSACSVVSAAGSVAGAGISAVSTAVSTTGSVVVGTVKAVTP